MSCVSPVHAVSRSGQDWRRQGRGRMDGCMCLMETYSNADLSVHGKGETNIPMHGWNSGNFFLGLPVPPPPQDTNRKGAEAGRQAQGRIKPAGTSVVEGYSPAPTPYHSGQTRGRPDNPPMQWLDQHRRAHNLSFGHPL